MPKDTHDSGPVRALEAREEAYRSGDVVIGRYRLVRPIGKGGMGVVWVARSLVLDVDVALKLIPSSNATPLAAARMTQEARAAAQLGHPALVRVTDFGETEQHDPFLVMELLHGESLSDVLENERLEPVRAVQLLLPIADGLATAHEKGIVHRDLKPDNIFLARDEFARVQPKLLDFGIAKLRHVPADTKLTQAGYAVGSPGYMSPEQALGRDDIDHRADIWAFCVVLYECITGRLPFDAPNYNALMRAIVENPPPPTTAFGVGDDALWQIISRGLAKRRTQRYGGMFELGRALAEWLQDRHVSEDVCGMSLRATWLGSADSRVSLQPKPRDTPDAAKPLIGSLAGDSQVRPVGSGALAVADPNETVSTLRPPPSLFAPQRRWQLALILLAAGAAAGAIITIIVLATTASRASENPRPPPEAAPAALPSAPRAAPTPAGEVTRVSDLPTLNDDATLSPSATASTTAPRKSVAPLRSRPKKPRDFGF